MENGTAAAEQLAEILKRVARFTSRKLASSYAHGHGRTMWVMLGDDGRFWVARPVDCGRLEQMGYEYAD